MTRAIGMPPGDETRDTENTGPTAKRRQPVSKSLYTSRSPAPLPAQSAKRIGHVEVNLRRIVCAAGLRWSAENVNADLPVIARSAARSSFEALLTNAGSRIRQSHCAVVSV
jgi:hypothetical protein